ncbi:DNA primase family protein [Skermanella stibiiresistens]|nr:phage/plasmid primase, P4 family [Skermanella stibiiresistens]
MPPPDLRVIIGKAFDEAEPYEPDKPRGRGPGDEEFEIELAGYLKNDLGNAKRLIARFGRDLLYVAEVGWHVWVGTHWSLEDGGRRAKMLADDTAMAIFYEAEALRAAGPKGNESPEEFQARLEKHRKWGVTSGNGPKLAAMLAQAQPYVTQRMEELDAHPDLFNVRNGTLEVRMDVEGLIHFRPHDRDDLITRLADVSYDPDAVCPAWLQFIGDVQPSAAQREYLQRWHGYGLTGRTSLQKVAMYYGFGSNGKSTFLETIEKLMGNYALRLLFASLLQDDRRRGADATPDIANLPGRRLVVAAEPDTGATFSVGTIKILTERDTMQARHLNKGFFSFIPQHHLTLMFNEQPVIKATDDGTWRRIDLVPWRARYIEAREAATYPDLPIKDYELPARLLGELPGILNWLLDGLRLYLETGLEVPEDVVEATEKYRADSDPVGEFIRAALRATAVTSPPAFISGKELYIVYQRWCEESGMQPFSMTRFGKLVKTKLTSETKGTVRYLHIEVDPRWLKIWDRL